MIKKEMESFEETRIQEFKKMFIKYLEDHMELQLKVIVLLTKLHRYAANKCALFLAETAC